MRSIKQRIHDYFFKPVGLCNYCWDPIYKKDKMPRKDIWICPTCHEANHSEDLLSGD